MSLVDRIDGVLHEETQVRDDGRVDLTAAAVSRVSAPGRVDFGGGELEPADRSPVPTGLRSPDDDYEWWHLGEGQYLVEYNETLAGDEALTLQTRTAVLERGAFHPTLTVSTLPAMPLSVGGAGLLLKENGRVTTARPPDER